MKLKREKQENALIQREQDLAFWQTAKSANSKSRCSTLAAIAAKEKFVAKYGEQGHLDDKNWHEFVDAKIAAAKRDTTNLKRKLQF